MIEEKRESSSLLGMTESFTERLGSKEGMKVGILAVQGDFEAHAKTLAHMGADYVFVRTPRDLEGVDAVILPGGESTTQWKFLVEERLDKVLLDHAARGRAIFGTCAGAILLAREVCNPAQQSLGLADITVIRNAYGRQLASEVRHGSTAISSEPIEMVFIRAPVIERVGPDVEVLAKSEGQPVLIRQGRILIATFHPELTSDTTVHEYFLSMVRGDSTASVRNDPLLNLAGSGKDLWSTEHADE
jgi:pyridoxal 5'-phosphate synthase pdxT subunit